MIETVETYLKSLGGETITRVFLDQWACGFLTDEDTYVSLEGVWFLYDNNGDQIDRSMPLEDRGAFHLWRVCGTKVEVVTLTGDLEDVLLVTFDNGYRLEALSGNGYTDWHLRTPAFDIYSDGLLHFTEVR